jgi:hypothetical protein
MFKIQRLAYRFSIDFKIHTLGYGFFPNFFIHVSVSNLYSIFPGSDCIIGCSKIGRPILGIYKSLADIREYGNWETEPCNSVLETTRQRSFISGNTLFRTRHLYWILTGPSFAVHITRYCSRFRDFICLYYIYCN